MKRTIGYSTLGILLLVLVFGCTFGMTLEERIAQFETDLNLTDRSDIYMNFHSTSTLDYDAIRDPTYFDITLPVPGSGDTPYDIVIVDDTNAFAVTATIDSTAMGVGSPYDAIFGMKLEGFDYKIVSLQVDYGAGMVYVVQ